MADPVEVSDPVASLTADDDAVIYLNGIAANEREFAAASGQDQDRRP